jgi:putative flavoprotein involved in K+ transport
MSSTQVRPAAAAVDQWLSSFDEALTQADAGAAAQLFAADCFWRDLVAFTWNIKTVEGVDGVRDVLEHTLAHVRPSGWRTTEEPTEDEGVTEAWIAFETATGRGTGHLRLREGKAWTLLTTLTELKGYEERARDRRPKGVHHGADPDRVTWLEQRRREADQLGHQTQPEVVRSDTPKDPGPWEGEERNMWKPTQQAALWFHGGNLHQSRYYSLYLALQLKARAEGIETPVYGLQEVHHTR